MNQQCSYKDCNREVYAGKDKCIFHAEKKTEQEVRDFRIALARHLHKYQLQRMLLGRLQQYRTLGSEMWQAVKWDFHGFIFPDSKKVIGRPIHFGHWRYSDGASFDDATFQGDADFSGAIFLGTVHFDGATFQGGADFSGAIFLGTAHFDGATFQGDAGFRSATFKSTAWFRRATFQNNAWFDGATFQSTAWFEGVTFQGKTTFLKAIFKRVTYFYSAELKGKPEFPIYFREVDLRKAVFSGAKFRHVDLRGANIEGIDLTAAKIHRVKIFAQDLAKARISPEQLSGFDVEEIPEEAEARELIRHPKGLLRIELKAEEPSVIALMQLFLNYERTYDLLYALFFGQYADAEEYFRLILSPYSLVPERFRLKITRIQYGSPFVIDLLADANIIEILATSGAAIALWKWVTPKGLKDAVEAWKLLKEGKKLDKEAKKLELEIEEKELDLREKTKALSDRQLSTLPISRTSEEMDSVRELIASRDFKADPRVFELVDELLSKLLKEQVSQKDREKIAKFTQIFLEELAKSNENLPETLKITSVKAKDTGEEL